MRHFIYVSRSLLPSKSAAEELGRIVELARERNVASDITGSLIFSGDHFAQLLEGAPEGLEPITKSILADSRHADITVLVDEPLAARAFRGWALTYQGTSRYVDGHIKRLVGLDRTRATEAASTRDLSRLMKAFARASNMEVPDSSDAEVYSQS